MSGRRRRPASTVPLRSDVRTDLAVPVNRGAPDQHRVGSAPKYRLVADSDDALAILLAHYLAVLPHEFMHSFVAWATGIKADPFDIHWGGGSFGNVLLLYNIDEKIDYKAAYAAGKGASVAAAVLAGPGTNAVLIWWSDSRCLRGAPVLDRGWRTWRSGSCSCSLPMCTTMSRSGWPRRMAMSGNGSGPRICPPDRLYRTVLPESLDSSGIASAAGKAIVLIVATVVMFTYFTLPLAFLRMAVIGVHRADVGALDSRRHLGELAAHRHTPGITGSSGSGAR